MWTLPQGKDGDLVTKPPFAPWGIPIYRRHDVKEIELTQGRVTLVDDADYEWLMQWKWTLMDKGQNALYAYRSGPRNGGRGKTIMMHRQVMHAPIGIDIDHRDGNGLHNCRSNLRFCNDRQNQANQRPRLGYSSKYKGVSWIKREHRWRVGIKNSGKSIHLGYFDDEIEAALAYNAAALELSGEFARLNVIEEA